MLTQSINYVTGDSHNNGKILFAKLFVELFYKGTQGTMSSAKRLSKNLSHPNFSLKQSPSLLSDGFPSIAIYRLTFYSHLFWIQDNN